MTRLTSVLVTAALLAAGVAAGVGLQKARDGAVPGLSAQEKPEASPVARQLQESFNKAAEYAMRSVVHITTLPREVGEIDPMEWWRNPPQLQQNIGSGVILSAEGHILTNHHVVRGSRSCRVRFVDGAEFQGEIVGEDPESDLAVLKIGAGARKLQPLAFADSDKVRVGDWVIALGSPFGYNHTATAGIVSAKHRRTDPRRPYEDFIQTDAAINPGNSGGALVNINGELVGINAAIVSNTRSYEGIGLAIASNLCAWVKERLIREGRVRRGYLGINPVDINEQLVEALKQEGIRSVDDLLADLGLDSTRGVFIYAPPADGPAARAGLRRGDVIVEFNGRPVSGAHDFFFRVAEMEPGRKVAVRFLRDRKRREAEIEMGERPAVRGR